MQKLLYPFQILFGVLIIFVAPFALAFGDEGHEIVAAIAFKQLTPAAREKIQTLLDADPDTLTEKDFVSRATWADKFRDSDRNTTKVHYNATHNWHFVDLSLDKPDLAATCNLKPFNGLASQGEVNDCVVDKIEEFVAELKNDSIPQTEKILALKFLLHFVGDLHQPLHAENHQDEGGNKVTVKFIDQQAKRSNTSNLHSFWDRQAVENLGLDANQVANQLLSRISSSEKKSWCKGSARDWALESNHLAKLNAYQFKGLSTFVDKDGSTAYVLDDQYQNKSTKVVRLQLERAGVRLAFILNDAFDHH